MKIRPDFFRPRAFWIVEGDAVQGYVDLDDPENLDLEYTKVIASILDILDFGNVVHIGGGGLMLPRYIFARRPSVLQTVFEPDMEMIEFVGKSLQTLEGFHIVNSTGEDAIAKLPDDFTDLTIVDAFQGDAVPAELLSEDFFADLFRVSTTVLFNTIQIDPIEVPVPAYEHGLMLAPEAALKGKSLGNVMFMWSKEELPVDKIRQSVPYTVVEIHNK